MLHSHVLPDAIDLHGKRSDALHAATVDVAEQHELCLVGCEVMFAHLYGFLEGYGLAAGQCRGLDHHHLADAVGCGLREERPVVADAIWCILVDKPATHVHMALLQHQQGMQTAGFQHRGKEHGEVHAGAQFLFKHTIGQPHTLSCLFVAGRWSRIDQSFASQCLINGCHLRPNPVGILRLVFVEGRTACEFLQHCCSIHLHPRQLRSIRCDESSQNLRTHAHSRPFVEGQQTQRECELGVAHGEGESRFDALGQFAQFVEIGLHVEVGHAQRHASRHAVEHTLGCGNQLAAHFHVNLAPVIGCRVGDFNKFQTFLSSHCHGIVQTGQKLHLYVLRVNRIAGVHYSCWLKI